MRPRPCLIPPPTPHDDSLQRWRRPTRILLLRALILIGAPILSLVIVIQILHYRWAMAAVSGVALGVFVLSTFGRRRRLCDQHRAAILIVTFLALGMLGLRTFGLYGLSPSLLVAAVVLAVLLLGPRTTLISGGGIDLGLPAAFGSFTPALREPLPHRVEGSVLLALTHQILVFATALGVLVGAPQDIITARQRELRLALQLQGAVALARCVRLLLTAPRRDAQGWAPAAEALSRLRVALAASWLFVYQYCDGALVCVTELVALNFTPARCGKRAADARHQTAP